MSEKTSLEEANGCAAGFSGKMSCYNADAEARFSKALMQVGKWVESEAGAMLGHIKAAITLDDGSGITLNLTDLRNGVEKHGELEPQEKVNFTFMCAVLDVDEHELKHVMYHAIEDTGLDIEFDEHEHCHCHDHHHEHGHECHCHDHEHHHDGECHCHDHDEECECCCHEDGKCVHVTNNYYGEVHIHYHYHYGSEEECKCHCHDGEHECHCHDHEHHHHHDGECHCHDHHDHDEECHCHDHHHDDDEHECCCHHHD